MGVTKLQNSDFKKCQNDHGCPGSNTVNLSNCVLVHNSRLEILNYVPSKGLWWSEVAACAHSEAFTIGR